VRLQWGPGKMPRQHSRQNFKLSNDAMKRNRKIKILYLVCSNNTFTKIF
jgi:hypothetical protein